MKSFLWSIIKTFFSKEIALDSKNYCLGETEIFRQKMMDEKRKATLINYPVGTKVILRSNEPNDLVIGHVISHLDIAPHREILITVKDDKTEKEITTLNPKPAIWSQEAEDALLKLNWAEQWNVMSSGNYIITRGHKWRREQDFSKENKNPTKNV